LLLRAAAEAVVMAAVEEELEEQRLHQALLLAQALR
jgi:hypothetical protein